MDSVYRSGETIVSAPKEIWESFTAEENLAFEHNDSTTDLSSGLYRSLSESGVDLSSQEALFYSINLRRSLQMQLRSLRLSKLFVSTVSRLVNEMASTVSSYLDISASIVPYGSIASNLCLTDSSIDLLLFIPPGVFNAHFSSQGRSNNSHPEIPIGMVKEFEFRQSMRKALVRISELLTVFCGLRMMKISDVVPLTSVSPSSRVPVLTMTDPVSGVIFEIVCNNVMPVFSTRLIKSYNSLVPTGELRDFVLLVKNWAKRRMLLGSGNGELSGYTWTLLCIFYTQACLNLMPSLQDSCKERQQWTDPFGSSRRCDVGFLDEKDVASVLLPDSVSLLFGFLDFFANYWNWTTGVISVRLGRIVYLENPEVYIKQSLSERINALVIEDPFDIKKNLCTGSLDRLRNELSESALLVSAGGSVRSLMTPASLPVPVAVAYRRRPTRADSVF